MKIKKALIPDAMIILTACDAGQYTIYALTTDFRLIKVCSSGDSGIISTDESSLEIKKLCEEMHIQ